MEKVRKHILFFGQVQGVGFRYRACYIARTLGLTGYVRNLENGAVEMEAQGNLEDIVSLIAMMQQERLVQIEDYEMTDRKIRLEKDFLVWN